MASHPGVHVPLRFLRALIKKGSQAIRQRVGQVLPARPPAAPELAPIRVHANNTPLSRIDRIRLGRRWLSTQSTEYLKSTRHDGIPKHLRGQYDRSHAPVSRAFKAHSPFASTLRPNLTGGVLPRTAGGYSLGNAAGPRFFSCSANVQADVIAQVSQSIRAFILSGEDKFGSYTRSNGTKGNLGVRALLAASMVDRQAPGAYVDFDLSPSFTCLSPLNPTKSLEDASFLAELSADFGNMITEITATHGDIHRLAKLGDLPISMVGDKRQILRVHFPGCDREFVENMCNELDIRRGIVHEDERFTFGASLLGIGYHKSMAGTLDWKDMLSTSSVWSEDGEESESDYGLIRNNNSSPADFSDAESLDPNQYFSPSPGLSSPERIGSDGIGYDDDSEGYEGLEGIHRFLGECEDYRQGRSRHAWA